MMSSTELPRAFEPGSELERPLAALEAQLGALAGALRRQDMGAVDLAAAELHKALASAVDHFGRAARAGGVPPVMRQRLALAGGQVAAQREALARATASLDRAMDVLLPRQPNAGLYSAIGGTERLSNQTGSLLA